VSSQTRQGDHIASGMTANEEGQAFFQDDLAAANKGKALRYQRF